MLTLYAYPRFQGLSPSYRPWCGSRTSCTQTTHDKMVGTWKRYGIVKYYVQETIKSSFMQFLN